ncbi:MAG: hypothetical protein ACI8WB_001094, partial [Phenylobacterium sp.]
HTSYLLISDQAIIAAFGQRSSKKVGELGFYVVFFSVTGVIMKQIPFYC